MIAFIGASKTTVPFIQAAKNIGLKTVAFDKNPLANGSKLVDRFYNIGVEEYDDIYLTLQLELIKGCFTYSSNNDALKTWGDINRRWMLNEGLWMSVLWTTDKRQMKYRLERGGIPTPPFAILDRNDSTIRDYLQEYGKVVVKPIDGTGGENVRMITKLVPGLNGGMIAEPYLEGPVYSVDGFVSNGKRHIFAVSVQKTPQSKGRFILRGFETLGIQESFMKAGLAMDVVKLFGIDNSFYSVDMIDTKDGLQVIDVGLLLDAKLDRLFYHMDIDVYDVGIQLAMGLDVEIKPGELFEPGYSILFIYPPNKMLISEISRWDIFDPDEDMIAREK